MKTYEYNIFPENSPEEFRIACLKIEKAYPNLEKEPLLTDVDGSKIQIYHIQNRKVIVYDDYEVGAVYVLSDLSILCIHIIFVKQKNAIFIKDSFKKVYK